MAKGFVCIKCGIGTLVKSNMKMTPDGKPYCRNEIGCAARVAKQTSRHLWKCAVQYGRTADCNAARLTGRVTVQSSTITKVEAYNARKRSRRQFV
jgi:hypothetical protein